jgi:hypothetical protein
MGSIAALSTWVIAFCTEEKLLGSSVLWLYYIHTCAYLVMEHKPGNIVKDNKHK